MSKDTGYILAKLEEIHDDIQLLQVRVDDLRQESAGRKAVTKVLLGGLGAVASVLGWVIYHVV